jgi:hypothetical protein
MTIAPGCDISANLSGALSFSRISSESRLSWSVTCNGRFLCEISEQALQAVNRAVTPRVVSRCLTCRWLRTTLHGRFLLMQKCGQDQRILAVGWRNAIPVGDTQLPSIHF